ncbi:hypothetical protein KKD37_04345 [Patescibacteria group bacterium]|nr:hypothetical protein [Patescibacteria group bacterium]
MPRSVDIPIDSVPNYCLPSQTEPELKTSFIRKVCATSLGVPLPIIPNCQISADVNPDQIISRIYCSKTDCLADCLLRR